jgi:pimeloyl-ACP methyl ester carboxylesterase
MKILKKLLTLLTLSSLLFFGGQTAVAAERWQTLPHPPTMPKALKHGYAPVNGIKMYYAVYGKPHGKPVLFIHGGLANADIWANEVRDLSSYYKIIVADSRGHGRSTRTDEPYSYKLMTSDYVKLLDYLHIKKVDLVGWSDGGIIGLEMAIYYPNRLHKLFAQSANSTPSGVDDAVANGKQFTDYINWMQQEYQKLSPTPNDYKNFLDAITKMWSTQPDLTKAKLAKITTPTLIVGAEHDVIKLSDTEFLAHSIPHAKLLIMKNTSHFALLQAPKLYSEAIHHFFGKW